MSISPSFADYLTRPVNVLEMSPERLATFLKNCGFPLPHDLITPDYEARELQKHQRFEALQRCISETERSHRG